MKKHLAVALTVLLSGCNDKIDCNTPSVINDIKSSIILGFTKAFPMMNHDTISSESGATFNIEGNPVKEENKNIQICEYNFKIHPAMDSAVEFYNTTPISVQLSEKDGVTSIISRNDVVSSVIELIRNENIRENKDVKPTEKQAELIESTIKKEAEREREKADKEKLEIEKKEKERKKTEEIFSTMKAMSDDSYHLISKNDLVIFDTINGNYNLTDEKYLEYFSSAYNKEIDPFKKEDIKASELERIKSEFSKFKKGEPVFIKYPAIISSLSRNTNFIGMTTKEMDSYVGADVDGRGSLASGFDVSNNTLDLSKTDYSAFCNSGSKDPNSINRFFGASRLYISITAKNNQAPCLIKFKDRDDAKYVYDAISNYDKRIGLEMNLYLDGTTTDSGLNAYNSSLKLVLRDQNNNNKEYITSK
ncbi:hypothetical protein [Pectobacterium polaris]|uniref:hypothetical protein n=1 Tax=Pectobacterium polaris TaxID=2042057 RepID=UPI001F2FF6D1|nr:hypothetical protein [Pectobacterium polaris]